MRDRKAAAFMRGASSIRMSSFKPQWNSTKYSFFFAFAPSFDSAIFFELVRTDDQVGQWSSIEVYYSRLRMQ
jgi:hypothetical protein